MTKDEIKKIAHEYGTIKGSTELAKELGVSKQRISQVASQLRQAGIDVPNIRTIQNFKDAVKELIKEKEER